MQRFKTEARGLFKSVRATTAQAAKREAFRYWRNRGHDVRPYDVRVLGVAR